MKLQRGDILGTFVITACTLAFFGGIGLMFWTNNGRWTLMSVVAVIIAAAG